MARAGRPARAFCYPCPVSKTFALLAAEHDDVCAKTAAALERLAHLVFSLQWRAAASRGLTALQAFLLGELSARPELGVRELADRFGLRRPTVSRALATLQAKGLVVRAPDRADRRRVVFANTAQGDRVAAAVAEATGALTGALGVLPPPQQEVLWTALLQLLVVFENAGLMAAHRLCLTCRFYRPPTAEGPAFCSLLGKPLRGSQLRLDCPDHQTGAQAMAEKR